MKNKKQTECGKHFVAYEEMLWWGIALGMIGTLILTANQSDIIGRDWRTIYRPTIISNDFINSEKVANPPYVVFMFYPLALMSPLTGYLGVMLLNVVCFRIISLLSSVNKWLIFPSFPALWMLVYGQIDGLVALGVALGAWAVYTKKPYFQGVAILLLFLKPHIGAILAIVYFIWQKDWRTIVPIGFVFLLSVLFWGIAWPIEWVKRLIFEARQASQAAGFSGEANSWNNIGLFPYGLLSWLALLFPYSWKEKVPVIVSASILSSPYTGGYSLLSVMGTNLPAWIYPIFSLPFLGGVGYRLILLAPIIIIIWPILKYYLHSPMRMYKS